LDLLARLLAGSAKAVVAVENPVYHGLIRVLKESGCAVAPVPVDEGGVDVEALEKVLAERRPRLLIVTSSFQNPTGATLSVDRRKTIVRLAHRFGTLLVENDIYSELRYEGEPVPTLKELDQTGNTILLRSYSKIAFPGLRVGWVLAPRPVVARLAEKKQWADLHSDHLSQAILLRFAESGELAHHLERTRQAGKDRLHAVCEACSRYLPSGTRWTRPQGGMSLWVELPAPLRAESLLLRARERGIDYLPGSYFSSGEAGHSRALRLGFGGLSPVVIRRGVQILGEVASEELAAYSPSTGLEPAMALV
jgi:2-aminoadipate transaminase